jgi:lipid II isoglutaminyl synthase (glutamine-hydrolysing)
LCGIFIYMFVLAVLYSYFAKFVVVILKLTGKGSGTALPGYLIENYFPGLLSEYVKGFEQSIIITGTNGKTTSRSMIVKTFEDNGQIVCTNKGGANIYRGIVSTLISNWNWKGKLKSKILILEVEEATLPKFTKFMDPTVILFTNIFRDQLDAYGEIDKTLEFFKDSLNQTTSKIVINSDDHKLLSILDGIATNITSKKIKYLPGQTNPETCKRREVYGFGVKDTTIKMLDYEESSTFSEVCYESQLFATKIVNKNLQSNLNLTYTYKNNKADLYLTNNLLGTYNVYNILASLVITLPIIGEKSLDSLSQIQPVFGRGEKISYRNKEIWIFLVKNPAGMNQVLDLINENFDQQDVNICYLVNDKIADGKDVSWLWDCDFEEFVKNAKMQHNSYTSGTRGLDMLLRLEHANLDVTTQNYYSKIEELVEEQIFTLSTKPQKFIFLATYTAMLKLRLLLSKRIPLSKISDDGN